MNEHVNVVAPPHEVAHAILRRTGIAPERRGENHYVVDLRLQPERMQVASAERELARRGVVPTLRNRRGCVRLDIIADGMGSALRVGHVMMLGGVSIPLSDAQERTVVRILEELRTAVGTTVAA